MSAENPVFARILSQFDHLYKKVQELYGPKSDLDGYQFSRVILENNGPHIRFFDRDPNEVAIALNYRVLNDEPQGLCQLAHEIVHLLYVRRDKKANMLEEGAAVNFSIYGPIYQSGDYRDKIFSYLVTEPCAKNYADALDLYRKLPSIDDKAIIKIRAIHPDMSDVKPGDIQRILPGVDDGLAAQLCEKRQMRQISAASDRT
ncbi:hypothetical protein [Methylobacterium sp. WSM2598]|uniref:hypothetical protein n=1 Tax=Methylobacterium sp. WSM2598 TaxID=398261 RepID=UPI0012F6E357|nr:hypothetical protein [Methylobacterium sp. WSM2598]